MKKLLSAAAIAALLIQSVAAFAKDQEPVKISGPANAKGVTAVTIGAFNVGFIFESIDRTAASGGLMGAFGGTTSGVLPSLSTIHRVRPLLNCAPVDHASASPRRNSGSPRASTVAVASPASVLGEKSWYVDVPASVETSTRLTANRLVALGQSTGMLSRSVAPAGSETSTTSAPSAVA